jgi:hypothetical protein
MRSLEKIKKQGAGLLKDFHEMVIDEAIKAYMEA